MVGTISQKQPLDLYEKAHITFKNYPNIFIGSHVDRPVAFGHPSAAYGGCDAPEWGLEAIQFCLFASVLAAIAIVSASLMRVVAGVILIVDVTTLYFMTGFGVILNQEMNANILKTDGGEVSALIDWKIFAWGIILDVIPAAFLFAIKIKPHPYWHRLLIAPLALGVLALILTVSPNPSKWIDKNGLELGGRILPWSYVAKRYAILTKIMNATCVRKKSCPIQPAQQQILVWLFW